MVESKDFCVVTSDINEFNKFYLQSDIPNIYRASNVADLLSKRLETEFGINEETTSEWNK